MKTSESDEPKIIFYKSCVKTPFILKISYQKFDSFYYSKWKFDEDLDKTNLVVVSNYPDSLLYKEFVGLFLRKVNLVLGKQTTSKQLFEFYELLVGDEKLLVFKDHLEIWDGKS